MTEELKSCPFCGGIAKLFHYPESSVMDITAYAVECLVCQAEVQEDTKQEAVEGWNKRVDCITLKEDW